jgi:hypothetical protein
MSAAKRQMFEDAEHDSVIQKLRNKLYEMADLLSSFRPNDSANSLDLVRGTFRHDRIRHLMTVTTSAKFPSAEFKAAFDAKYPGREIPLNIQHEDPDYLSAERFAEASSTMHALADMLSWWVDSEDDDLE